MGYILAVDQGTTSTTTLIVNNAGIIMGIGTAHHPQHYPHPGWVEHNGNEIKQAVATSITNALTNSCIDARAIVAIGITNQRETLCVFDHESKPLRNFIVWQCRRSETICARLKQEGLEKQLHATTGLYIDPYFSASKLAWLFEQEPELKRQACDKKILVGTIDSFLTHWFTDGRCHISDVTNASRTMLMNIKTCEWDRQALEIFSIPKACLPQIVKNLGPFGVTKNLGFLPDNIPIAALVGDQQGALFGQACFDPGDAKATFGTGCFILLNTGFTPIFSHHGLLTSVAYALDKNTVYCLEGSAFIAGAAIEFLINAFGLVSHASEIEALARSVEHSDGVTFIPALCGLGAPHWQPQARGAFLGLTRGTTRAHIARATLEGIAAQNADICRAMAKDAGELTQLKVDGGASTDDLLMQIHADLLRLTCLRTETPQKTALGAAYMAGLAMGIFKNLNDIKQCEKLTHRFEPRLDISWAKNIMSRYHDAIKKIQN